MTPQTTGTPPVNSPTPTPSLRRRATAATLGLFAALLLIVGFAVDVALGTQLRTELDTRLADRVDRAHSFTAAGVSPVQLPVLLGGRDIRVRVTTPDGVTYGDPGVAAAAPDAPATQGQVPATTTVRPPPPPTTGPSAVPGPSGGPGPGPVPGPREPRGEDGPQEPAGDEPDPDGDKPPGPAGGRPGPGPGGPRGEEGPRGPAEDRPGPGGEGPRGPDDDGPAPGGDGPRGPGRGPAAAGPAIETAPVAQPIAFQIVTTGSDTTGSDTTGSDTTGSDTTGAAAVDNAGGSAAGGSQPSEPADPTARNDAAPTGSGQVDDGSLDDLPTPQGPAASSSTATVVLADGSRVVLVADTRQIDDVRAQLRAIMLLTGLGVLAIAAIALLAAVARALRPLDRLTAVAGQITAGDRGRRLRPDRSGTELGRAAVAFDSMLDALESTEARAQHSATEAHTAAERARRAETQTRRFLSDAAHELRTPLAGMQAVAEQMQSRSPGPDDPHHRRVSMLIRETTRTSRLVTDMLDLARIDSGLSLRPESTDLTAIVDAEVERIRTLSPALTVERTGDRDHVRVEVDPCRIAQILANLGNNARRHTPAGGTITVDLTGGQVTVTDTGPGVPAAEQERIFERLVRLDEARDRESGGSGLGLAIARGLARAHGGELTYVPGVSGARFRLTLPTT